jgi:DNA-directed RNA polymerase specialized sigma24 family protein
VFSDNPHQSRLFKFGGKIWGSGLHPLNGEFMQPLPFGEVKATAKSISRWTWQRMTPAGLQDLIDRTHTPEQQAERGRKVTNQVEAGVASGQARRLFSEQDRATARLMQAQGHTQQSIAAVLGVRQGTISKWLQ